MTAVSQWRASRLGQSRSVLDMEGQIWVVAKSNQSGLSCPRGYTILEMYFGSGQLRTPSLLVSVPVEEVTGPNKINVSALMELEYSEYSCCTHESDYYNTHTATPFVTYLLWCTSFSPPLWLRPEHWLNNSWLDPECFAFNLCCIFTSKINSFPKTQLFSAPGDEMVNNTHPAALISQGGSHRTVIGHKEITEHEILDVGTGGIKGSWSNGNI